jgi:phospholipase A2
VSDSFQEAENACRIRRSETFEQQQHERTILEQYFPSDNLASENADSKTPIKQSTEPSGKLDALRSRLHGFWKGVVKPEYTMIKSAVSIESVVMKDIQDPVRYPEVGHVAHVRRGIDLCVEEKEFLSERKDHVRDAFAKYLGLDPKDVHPEDVPIIAFGGSGGGYRAMIGVLGYCQAMKKSGLWDVLTYVAGVSGSCWALAAYYTFGNGSMETVIEHCKTRLSPHHPLSPDAIRLLLSSPGGTYSTLGPLIQKHHSGLESVAMDLYSVFTTGYLFLQPDPALLPGQSTKIEVAGKNQDWAKWSQALIFMTGGKEPMPILTAIRHERPWEDWASKEHPFVALDATASEHVEAQNAWFQWFEMTPFEIGCDELEAWVPTWGFGRPFSGGKSVMQLPEQSLALLLGLCTSAPAGPLTSYLATIKRMLPTNGIGSAINGISSRIADMWGAQGKEDFEGHHPLHACNEHNFMHHLTEVAAGESRPEGIENAPRLELIDSGMDNNCPTYVMLHSSRKVDIILNMDASSDVLKDTFQERVDQIGSRRGLKFTKRHPDVKAKLDPKDPNRFAGCYAQIYDGTLCERPATVIDSYGHKVKNPPAPVCENQCTMVYMPLLPSEQAVPGFDPSTAKFSGSYNLVWRPSRLSCERYMRKRRA